MFRSDILCVITTLHFETLLVPHKLILHLFTHLEEGPPCNGIATGSARADIREIKMTDQRHPHSAFKVLLLRKHLLDVMLACCPCRYNKLIK